MKPDLKRALPYIFLVAGAIGMIASFELTYDKIQVLKNPAYNPACNLSPLLSCGSVMQAPQANVLGVPNTVFGLAAFSMLFMLGLAIAAGGVFKRWFWLLVNAGALAGFAFFGYLFFESVYRIQAICPYCFAVWLVVPPVLWYVTLYNLAAGHLKAGFLKPGLRTWLLRHHGDILASWYLLFFGVLIVRFWYYWSTLL